jgi:acid phosphatase
MNRVSAWWSLGLIRYLEGSWDVDKDLRLVQVQLIHRHGDRTPVAPAGQDLVFWEQQIPGGAMALAESWEELALQGSTLHRCPLTRGPFEAHFYDQRYSDPRLGQLTFAGYAQLRQLGQTIRKQYQTLLPEQYVPGSVLAYSTNFRRTVLSVDNLLLGLYPPESRPTEHAKIPIFVKLPIQKEVMFTYKCPSLSFFRQAILSQNAVRAQEANMAELKKLFITAYGLEETEFSWTEARDSLTVANAYGLPLPPTVDSDSVSDRILRHNCFRWNALFSSPHAIKFGIGRLVETVLARISSLKVDQSGPKLVVYSAHDTTLFMFLKALGVDMSLDWPPYASYLAIESYANDENEIFCRFVYNGEPLVIESKPGDPLSRMQFVPLKLLRMMWEQYHSQDFEAECIERSLDKSEKQLQP